MLPENPSFLIRGDDGQEYGPVDLDEIREWVRENRAGLGTEVRRDEPGALWRPWQNYPELVALLAEAQVTSPVPDLPGLVIAPVGRRVGAFVLDLVLVIIPILIICYTVVLIFFPDWVVRDVVSFNQYMLDTESGNQHPFTPPDPPPYASVIAELISNSILALYFTGFHSAHGQTPAKTLLRLRVVDRSGQKPSVTKSFLRGLILIFSMNLLFLPFTYAFFNPQRRTLHDFIAGTYVVEA
jgi:uncharacterized RDD family membrane protein YckC